MVCCCKFIRTFSFLGCAPEDLITPADARANLVILSFRVAGSVKLRLNLGGSEAIYVIVSRELTKDANKEPPNQTAYLVDRTIVSSSHIGGRGKRTVDVYERSRRPRLRMTEKAKLLWARNN